MSYLGIIGAHLLAGAALSIIPARRRYATALLAGAPLAALTVGALIGVPQALDGVPQFESVSWLPELGVAIDARLDALAVIFAVLIGTVGVAVVVFSSGYLSGSPRAPRFLGLVVLFAGGMAGLVAADNVFGLFVFWELTTITSYLLIGYDDTKGSARASALQAVLTTGLGGLVLLGGLVVLAQASGTTSISAMVDAPPGGTTAAVGLLLVLIGAFTKSAQAPFHFWLPGAMAAPTPASAYLHSATMVKAGILLLIRLAPGFAADPLWTPTVATVGAVTMAVGAWRALRQTDLKLLLAYGTVSQLGFITALVGIGTPEMLHAAVAVLVGHALFKSALFLVVGAVDSATGSRDIRVLSGLGARMPSLAVVGGLAAASMAGLPPLLGFVTKEAALQALLDGRSWALLTVVAAASALTAAYSIRFWWGAFGTKPAIADPAASVAATRPPSVMLWLPPGVLAVAGLVAGMAPGLVDAPVSAVSDGVALVAWPGLKPALAISAGVLAAGAAVYAAANPMARLQQRFEGALRVLRAPSADGVYRSALSRLNTTADRVTGLVQHGSLPVYLAVILLAVVTAPVVAWLAVGGRRLPELGSSSLPEAVIGLLIVVAAAAAITARRRIAAVLLLGAIGYGVAGIFVIRGAPDLALTLLLVETVAVAAFAFVLGRLPRSFTEHTRRLGRWARAMVALAVGVFTTGAALLAGGERSTPPSSRAYLDLAPDAGGGNVVNVILTDFRALDTLGEITVLAAAAIGVAALIRTGSGDDTEVP